MVELSLKNEFGSQFERHFNEDFTIEQFINVVLTSETIQTFTNTRIDIYIEKHQTDTNLVQDSLFKSSEPTATFEGSIQLT